MSGFRDRVRTVALAKLTRNWTGAPRSRGFPVELVGVDEPHAAFFTESRTRSRGMEPRTGNPRSPQRTWAENEMFPLLLLSLPDLLVDIAKAMVGFARRFRPTYALANVGHPSNF
jgi:hypothetical protein